MTPKEFYEQQRKLGLTEYVTSAPEPDYLLPFYQNIFRLMVDFSDQQTAEKDKRISLLEDEIKGLSRELRRINKVVTINNQATELYESLSRLVFLHQCEQEGLSSGQRTPEMWFEAVNKAEEVLTKINK